MAAKNLDIDIFPMELEFSTFTSDEVKQMSVVKIVTGLTFDALGYPLPGGLYDGAMGVYGRATEPCATCLKIQDCPGHIGHIELNALVYNPFFIHTIQKCLSIFCLHCHKIQIKDELLNIVILQLRLIQAGYIIEAQELENFKVNLACNEDDIKDEDAIDQLKAYKKLLKEPQNNPLNTKTSCAVRTAIVNLALQRPTAKTCIHCKKHLRHIKYSYKRLVYYIPAAEIREKAESSSKASGATTGLLAEHCQEHLRQIFAYYSELLMLLFPILKTHEKAKSPIDLFFLSVLPVTPPKARPTNVLRDKIVEHTQTAFYRNIIENNNVLRAVINFMKGEKDLPEAEVEITFALIIIIFSNT